MLWRLALERLYRLPFCSDEADSSWKLEMELGSSISRSARSRPSLERASPQLAPWQIGFEYIGSPTVDEATDLEYWLLVR